MKRKTATIDIRVEPGLIEKIDAWCAAQRVPPSRTEAIVHMIEHFLASEPPAAAPSADRCWNDADPAPNCTN